MVSAALAARAGCYRKLGDLAGCRATAEALERRNPADALSLYNAACCRAVTAEYETLKLTDAAGKAYDAACLRAVCASAILEDPKTPTADAARLAREQADLAMAWLHKAVAAGYSDVAHMKRDKDLDALREREDFKKLISELQAKRKKAGSK